jgi:putative membrane protein
MWHYVCSQLLLALANTSINDEYVRDGYHMRPWRMTGWVPWLNTLIWFVLFTALLLLVIRSVRGSPTPPSGRGPASSPIDIAKERYARGEISKEEFDRMREDLR